MSAATSRTADLVSVIVPCYNAAAYVGETLESVLAQTHPAIELVVVDDASTDESWAVIERVAGAHPARVTAIRLPENRKGGYARNRGVERSHGAYLMFLDADDLIAPDTLEALVETVRHVPDGIAVCPWRRLELVDGEWRPGPPDVPLPTDVTDHLAGWLEGRWVPPCAVLWRRDVYERTGGWDEALTANQDGDIAMRALADGARLVFTRRGEALYRQFASLRLSVSGNVYAAGRFRSWMRVLDKLEAQLGAQGRLAAYAPILGAVHNRLAVDAHQYGFPDLGRELAARGQRLAGGAAAASTRLGRLLVRLLGLEGKERVATFLARFGLASAERRKVAERVRRHHARTRAPSAR